MSDSDTTVTGGPRGGTGGFAKSVSCALFGAEWLPGPLSEACGVQHVKAALFDDTLILTGANLSAEYLTSRQDRYFVITGTPRLNAFVSDFLAELARHGHTLAPVQATAAADCATVDPVATTSCTATSYSPPMRLQPPLECMNSLGPSLRALVAQAREANPPPAAVAGGKEGCSWLLPLPQGGGAGVEYERRAVSWLLAHACATATPESAAEARQEIAGRQEVAGKQEVAGRQEIAAEARPQLATRLPMLVSSPYLNLPADYAAPLVGGPQVVGQRAAAECITNAALALEAVESCPLSPPLLPTLLGGSPTSSSFYNAAGLKGLIPVVYEVLQARLTAAARARGAPLQVLHYERPGWTYHAKGMWLWPPQHPSACLPQTPSEELQAPVLTLIGSSNFSERSVQRDLELSMCLITTDPAVRAALLAEQACLLKHSHHPPRSLPSRVGLLAHVLAPLVRTFL